jgi:hypothetical protein
VDTTTRFVIGLLALFTIQVTLGGTVVYLIRRRNRAEPAWSWLRAVGAFCVLGLVVAGVSLLPAVGRFAAPIASLVGLKRMSGLDILSTFILSFVMGILVFATAAVISIQLQVDLLGLRE